MNSNDKEASKGESQPQTETESERKAKWCKGCLHYSSSSTRNSNNNPTCVGISGTLQQFPSHTIGNVELKASKQGMNLANKEYVCLGYSIYLANKNSNQVPKLPICKAGIEMLLGKKTSQCPVHGNNKTQEHKHPTTPQPQVSKPLYVRGEEFFNRFTRNAGVVASGVAKNMNRVGNYAKETVDGIFDPPKKGPK